MNSLNSVLNGGVSSGEAARVWMMFSTMSACSSVGVAGAVGFNVEVLVLILGYTTRFSDGDFVGVKSRALDIASCTLEKELCKRRS